MIWIAYLIIIILVVYLINNAEDLYKIVKDEDYRPMDFLKEMYRSKFIIVMLVIFIPALILAQLFGTWMVPEYTVFILFPVIGLLSLFGYAVAIGKQFAGGRYSSYLNKLTSNRPPKLLGRSKKAAGVIFIIILLLVTLGRPFFFYSSVADTNHITGNIEVTTEQAPEVRLSEVRRIPWEIGSEYLQRGYGDSAPYLQTDVTTLEDDTDPTVIDGEMYWVNLPRYEFIKWFGSRKVPFYLMVNGQGRNASVQKFDLDLKVHKERIHWEWRAGRYAKRIPGYDKYTIEQVRVDCDDDFHPYVIIYMADPTYPQRYDNIERLIIIDAENGDMDVYDDLTDAPYWLEIVYPDYYVYDWIYWWGSSRYGAAYEWFNKKGIYRPSIQDSKLLVIDGNTYWYTPMTQAESRVLAGYMLTDTRTGESKFYDRENYVDYDTVRVQLDSYLQSGIIGYRRLTIREGYIYRVTENREMYVIPLYAGLTLQKIALIDPVNYTDEPIIASNITNAVNKLGEDTSNIKYTNETITAEGIFIDDDDSHIYYNNTIYQITNDDLQLGNQSKEEDLIELNLADSILSSGTRPRLILTYRNDRVVDVMIDRD